MRAAAKRNSNVFELKLFQIMAGVTCTDGIRNDYYRIRTGMVRELQARVDTRVLRWFGHIERIYEGRLVDRVMNAELNEMRFRWRPR